VQFTARYRCRSVEGESVGANAPMPGLWVPLSAGCAGTDQQLRGAAGGTSIMKRRRALLVIASAAVGGTPAAGIAADKGFAPGPALPIEGEMPSLAGATGWLNSPPLTPTGLRGKVVLVEFWTYSCINWLRTLPYVRAWAEKYTDRGLVVIGVHTPEFGFEKDLDNIRRAAKDMRLAYPIAIDSDYAVWRAFDNEYWPALYFFDAKGRLRHHHFGEGDYAQSEAIMHQLLSEAGAGELGHDAVSVDARGAEAEADWADLKSQETYIGYDRAESFASPHGAVRNQPHVYEPPGRLRLGQWSLSGDWTIEGQPTRLNQANGRIACRFHARDLHLVMGAPVKGSAVRFRVLLDGRPPGLDHGLDVDERGNGTVAEPRLYQLIRQRSPILDRDFEIEFLDPGVEAYSFTFG
jgi:thiol-disulfide isomerase/thioredoxin